MRACLSCLQQNMPVHKSVLDGGCNVAIFSELGIRYVYIYICTICIYIYVRCVYIYIYIFYMYPEAS